MPEGELFGFVVVYLPENRIYPDTSYDGTRIVELLPLEQAESLAVQCRDQWWKDKKCKREDTQVVAVYSLPYKSPQASKVRSHGLS